MTETTAGVDPGFFEKKGGGDLYEMHLQMQRVMGRGAQVLRAEFNARNPGLNFFPLVCDSLGGLVSKCRNHEFHWGCTCRRRGA